MNRFSLLASLAAFLVLSACAMVKRDRARDQMVESKADYKQCLRQHPNDASACEAFRKMFEADLKAFRAESTSGGGTVTIEK